MCGDGRRQFDGLIACVVAVTLFVATTVGSPGAASSAGPATVEALLVGDSVLNGLAQGYSAAGRAALAARHSFILDAAGCRRLITTSCRIPPGAAPTNALTEVRAWAGRYDRALVVAAGYDDPSSGPVGVGAAVGVMVAEAHSQGIEHVIWLTYREAGSAADVARFRASNAVLRGLQAMYPQLVLADWAGRSAGLPSGWFSADGIHLGPQAAAAMGGLIGDALDELPIVPGRCTTGVWSGAAAAVGGSSPSPPAAGGLQLLGAPVRFVDTRDLPGKLGAGRVLSVPIAGVAGVPGDAVAAMVSVTAVEPCADTFLTVFPCGEAVPNTSTVNAPALSIVANSAVVRLGDGGVCVYTLQPSDVIVDVTGWLGPGGDRSLAVAPVRLVDTRPGFAEALPVAQHRVGTGQLVTVAVGALAGIGPTATAATVNVTAVDPSAAGFITVLPGPCATVRLPPATSNLNVTPGHIVAASATVGLGAGELCVFTSTETDVVVDLQAVHGVSGGVTMATDPRRLVDTRISGRLRTGQSLPIALGANPPAVAVVVNVTAVDASTSGFLTVSPCGAPVPATSNLNFVAGQVVANSAVVSTDQTGQFCLHTSADTDVVVDLEGFVVPG